MAKNNWNDYSATAASNTDISGIDIDENCVPSNINDALRTVLAHTADVVSGTVALSSINIDGGSITGITDLAVADGGTGASTLTANGVLFGNGTSAIGVTAVGTSGQVLTSNGSSAPTFQDAATTYTHPNHSGEVTSTGDGAMVIASNVVDEDNLKVSNGPSDGYILTARSGNTGGMTWEAAAAGGATDIDGLSDAKKLGTSTYGIGSGALAAATAALDGGRNTAIGVDAGGGTKGNGAGNDPFDNTFIGSSAGYGVSQTGSTAGNVAIGRRAMQLHTGCINNVIIGKDSGAVITTGSQNVAVGRDAAKALTTGGTITAIGDSAGSTATTGTNNTIIGNSAAPSSVTVSNEITLGNTSVNKFRIPGINFIIKDSTATEDYVLTVDANGEAGWEAAGGGGASEINGLSDAKTNSNGFTIGVGTEALKNDDGTSNQNTAFGYQALRTTNSNFANTAVGYRAGYALTGTGDTNYGRDSSLFGQNAGTALTTGRGNTAFGAGALDGATTPDNNAAFGREAGGSVTTGASNVFVGPDAGYTTTTGSNNIILGNAAEASSATVSNEITLGNTSVDKFRIPGINFTVKDSTATEDYVLTVDANGEAGWEAAGGGGASDIDGLSDGYSNKRSIGLGSGALANLDDSYKDNIAIGENALNLLTTGRNSIAIGPNAGSKQYGTLNKAIMIGRNAGASVNINTGSSDCVLVGMEVGQYGDCDKSIILGHNLCNQSGSGSSEAVIISGNTGGGNHTEGTAATHVGYSAGSAVTTGTFNTMLGHLAGSTTTTASNVTCLGRGAVASGATTSNEITLGNSSISSLRCQVQTISSLSDRRDKKDIEELPLGIDFINTLKPVKFSWNMRDGAKVGQQEAGFIAQDLDEAQIDADAEDYLNLVLKNNPEKLEASYGKLVPVLVKAVQELSAEVAALKKDINNG